MSIRKVHIGKWLLLASFLCFSPEVHYRNLSNSNPELVSRFLSSPTLELQENQLPQWLKRMPGGLPEVIREGAPKSIDRNSQEARNYFYLSEYLEAKSHGLGFFKGFPPDEDLKNVYLLEAAVVDTLHKVAENPKLGMSSFERSLLVYHLSQTYSYIRLHAHRMAGWVQHELDLKLPGGTGLRYPVEGENLEQCDYLLNCRTDKPVSDEQRQKFYEEKKKKFVASGGDLSEMFKLDSESISKFKSLERFEYVQRKNGEIWVTPGKAGHVLLAEGRPVKAAGQLLMIKNTSGHWDFVVVSSGSGSYRPYLLSVDEFRSALSKAIGYTESKLIVTDEEPLAPLLISLAHKARGTKVEEVEAVLQEVKTNRKKFLNFLGENPALNPNKASAVISDPDGKGAASKDCVSGLSRLVGSESISK